MSITYKRLKYVVTAVIAELDEEGNVVGEQQTQPTAVYTPEQIQEFVTRVDADIESANLEASMSVEAKTE